MRSAGSTEYNYDNPIWRDVVSTGTPAAGDNVTIRFRVSCYHYPLPCNRSLTVLQTDNPGPWFLHCHIDFHLEAGFAVVMAEDIPDTKADNPVPREYIFPAPSKSALTGYRYRGVVGPLPHLRRPRR